jgi:hypothetical protein
MYFSSAHFSFFIAGGTALAEPLVWLSSSRDLTEQQRNQHKANDLEDGKNDDCAYSSTFGKT